MAENQEQKTAEELQAEAHLLTVVPDTETDQGAAGQSAAGVVTDPAESLAGLLGMVGFLVGASGLKNLGAVWSDTERNNAIAGATVPVLRKYAFGQRVLDFLSGQTPVEELTLVMALAPVVMSSVGAYRADVAEKKAANDESAGQVEEQGAAA
ncbi:MAG TPA: hypothetical protein VGE06_09600 [Flavisolibacter sp.]